MTQSPSPARPEHSSYRWVICSLLFFATTFNYLDRQVISFLKEYFCTPVDRGGFGWSNTDFANLTSSFTAFYAGMTIVAGWVIDRIGTKLGLALSLVVWSICGILNAFVGRLVAMHILIRSAFGIGEGGNFPASIKTVAEWFPKRERALRALKTVHARIPADLVVIIAAAHAMLAQLFDPLGHSSELVVTMPASPGGAQVLGRIKAESRGVSQSPAFAPSHSAPGLGCVLDQLEPAYLSQGGQKRSGRNIGRKMYREDSLEGSPWAPVRDGLNGDGSS